MVARFLHTRSLALALQLGAVVVASTGAACSSASPSPGATGPASCSNPGEATPGPADMHCLGPDGGVSVVQTVSETDCHPTAAQIAEAGGGGDDGGGDDGGAAASGCDYGDTLFGHDAYDDDCKYHVTWTSTPICEGNLGVTFTVTVNNNATGAPVTDIPAAEGMIVEAFITPSLDAACDNVALNNHVSPAGGPLYQTSSTSGVYTGRVVFDAPGLWTVRFHIHEECDDLFDDSPHGHAAFHVTVP